MQDYSGYGQPPIGDGGFGGPTAPMPPRPPRRRFGMVSYIGVALAAGALGAGTVVALYHPASSSSVASPAPSISAVPAAPAPSSSPVPLPSYGGPGVSAAETAVLKKLSPSLVIVNTTLQYTGEEAAGTGMVISADGEVLTNNHVIEDATKITATLVSTGRTYQVKVVGYDVTGDVALIKLQGASGLHPIPTASTPAKTGDQVVAMGNAEGQSEIVPATGQVTGVNQSITASDQGGTVSQETLHGMIQTNANIVEGDSGGPLATTSGDVLGMDTAANGGGFQQQQQQTTGFAIPINTALGIAHKIAAGQASSTLVIGYPPFVGIYIGEGTNSSPQAQAQQQAQSQNGGIGGFGNFGNGGCYTSDIHLSVPTSIASVNSGTLVLGTICDSPAISAGLTAGSVITAVNGQAVGSPQNLTSTMAKYQPGTTVSLTWVTPSGQTKTGNLKLTAGPPQ